MSDYISREAVLKIIEYAQSMNWTDSEAEIQAETDYDFFREMIKAQPAVDVVEVKRGELDYSQESRHKKVKTLRKKGLHLWWN